MSDDNVLDVFYSEADDLLEAMEEALLQLDEGQADLAILNDLFRSVHTIKGSAGIFGFDHIVTFTHSVENVLDRARDGKFEMDSSLLDIILKCRDHLSALVHVSLEDFQRDPALQQEDQELLSKLKPWLSEGSQTDGTSEAIPAQGTTSWHISMRLNPEALKNGMDPYSFITYLQSIGEIEHIETITDALPNDETYEPDKLYFGYEFALKTDATRETIENAFALVQDGSEVRIIAPDSHADEFVALIDQLPESNERIGEILIRCGAITRLTLDAALDEQITEKLEKGVSRPIGQVLVDHGDVDERVVEVAVNRQQTARKQEKAASAQLIKVDADRLDKLINLIGELVISRQQVDVLSKETGDAALIESVHGLGQFTEQIRDAALNLRMVEIGSTLQRFKRIVRDTSRELGKNIQLVIEGGDTELDRLMVEKLTDPLTHIVRNAMDHGIESTEARINAGKSETGTLRMAAYHDAGHVVIEISDDGGGIPPDRILEKAIEKGIVAAGATLSHQEVLQLVFHPGFSTAAAVTNLSGRGVGMDVVKSNVESLQGHIEIESAVGKGTTFKIRLPLTLAIIDGLHVKSGDTHFILPQASIIECTDLGMHSVSEGRHCVNLRGDMIPYVRLEGLFHLNAGSSKDQNADEARNNLLVVRIGDDRAGIVVDTIFGEIQTVVKPLSSIFKPLKGIGGSTLLGSGEIAFIVDIAQLIEAAVHSDSLFH